MNGLEFAPEEAVNNWKGAFGSQRGFSDIAGVPYNREKNQKVPAVHFLFAAYFLFAGTEPATYSLFAGTVLAYSLFLICIFQQLHKVLSVMLYTTFILL